MLNPNAVTIEDVQHPTEIQPGQSVALSHIIYGDPGHGDGPVLFTNPIAGLDVDRCSGVFTDGMSIRVDYNVNGEVRSEKRSCWPVGNADKRSTFTFEAPDDTPIAIIDILVRRLSDLEPVATEHVEIPITDPDDENGDDGSEPDPPNRPPIVTAAGPQYADVGDTVTVNALVSDPDGTIDGIQWVLPDGTTTSGQTIEYAFTRSGTYTFEVTVTDNSGATSSDTVTIGVSPEDPQTPSGDDGIGTLGLLAGAGAVLYAAGQDKRSE